MKFLIMNIIIILLGSTFTFAYQPNSQDVTAIIAVKTQLDEISSGNMAIKANFYIQLKNLKEQFSGYKKLEYYLDSLATSMITQINTEKIKAKIASKGFKEDFVNNYSGDIINTINDTAPCTGRYNTIDSISFAKKIPTALTIATRYRETNCGYYLPNNGDGPFQILSKDYGTGQITEGKFLKTIQDFIDFSQSKRTQYQSKLGISLTYTGFDMTGLVHHAALYNGGTISGNTIIPLNSGYLYDGYGQAFSGAKRYGIIPKFLKILDRELKTNY